MPDALPFPAPAPQSAAVALLNIRPEPRASRFTQELGAAFGARLFIVTSPLMRVEYLAPALPEGAFAALALTSETGAEAAGRLRDAGHSLPLRAYCVGDRTTEMARSLGFDALSAAGDAGDLLRMILDRHQGGRLLYLHGENRAADLALMLAGEGYEATSLPVYRQRPQALTAEAARLLAGHGPVLLPLFSPRSARLFLKAATNLSPERLCPVVISENTRAVLPEALAARAVLAARPDGAAMMAAIGRCYTGLP